MKDSKHPKVSVLFLLVFQDGETPSKAELGRLPWRGIAFKPLSLGISQPFRYFNLATSFMLDDTPANVESRQGWFLLLSLLLWSCFSSCLFFSVSQTHSTLLFSKVSAPNRPAFYFKEHLLSSQHHFFGVPATPRWWTKYTPKYEWGHILPRYNWLMLVSECSERYSLSNVIFEYSPAHPTPVTPLYL